MNRALLLLLPAALLSCAKAPTAVRPTYSGSPQAFKLLDAAHEEETASRTAKRTDLFVTTDSGEPVPSVVATGETGSITRHGGRMRLYGDAAGTAGWTVDNFLLIEVLDAAGSTVTQRLAVGFQQGVTLGSEQIDTAGAMKFAFDPGEVDISRYLPTHEPFRLRATALDVGGVGRVSDVYVVLSPDAAGGADEDLRDDL